MPVKRVLLWHPNPGTTVNSHILGEISHSLESLNGIKGGTWKAVLSSYKPILRGELPRGFMGLSFSEKPDNYYFLVRREHIVVEADSSVQVIMERLQSYKLRSSLNFEGTQYHLGDFRVKVGKVTPGQTDILRGIIMEVEYLPFSSIGQSKQIMEEFIEILQEELLKKGLPGRLVHDEPCFDEYGLSDKHGMQHTAVQYASVLFQLMTTLDSVRAVGN